MIVIFVLFLRRWYEDVSFGFFGCYSSNFHTKCIFVFVIHTYLCMVQYLHSTSFQVQGLSISFRVLNKSILQLCGRRNILSNEKNRYLD